MITTMKSHSLRRRSSVALAALLTVTAAACGGGDGKKQAPGVTDTEILLGSHQPLTGPYSAGYSKIAPATKAYFEYVNDQGGVHGRKINYKYIDDAYNPATTQQVVRKLVLQDKVFAIVNGLGTPTHGGVLEFLKANEVPDLFVSTGSRNFNQPSKYPQTFRYNPSYVAEGKVLARYIKQTHPGKKVCHLGQNDDFGRDSLAGARKVLNSKELVKTQQYAPTVPTVGPQIGAFKAADCQVVMLETVPPFTLRALTEAAKQNYKPTWVLSYVSGDYATLTNQLGDQKKLLDGIVYAAWLPDVTNRSDPWVRLFQRINAQYNKGASFDGIVAYGMSVAYDTVQVLQRNGRELTRESITATMEKGGFRGPALGPYGYSKTNHAGPSAFRITRLTDGDSLSPTYVTDDGDGPITEYTGQQAVPPSSGIPKD
ncbi:ABC transporter substrate-binding protein [Streptomyces sp. KR80]|uniref:ABC transporter substrate-binding protein n=1 Tax=Streptomyces sp. KR80 TaxID=3457426 RepID=UPI003FCF0ADE